MSTEQQIRQQVGRLLNEVIDTYAIPERAVDPFSSAERHYLRAGSSLGSLGLALYAEKSPEDVARAAINVAVSALAVASTTVIACLLAEIEISTDAHEEKMEDVEDAPF